MGRVRRSPLEFIKEIFSRCIFLNKFPSQENAGDCPPTKPYANDSRISESLKFALRSISGLLLMRLLHILTAAAEVLIDFLLETSL